MSRITITLSSEDKEALIALAKQEYRDPRKLAGMIIHRELKQRNMFPLRESDVETEMSMQEFIEQQIHAMILDLVERIVNGEFGEMSEDEMCSVPMFIFSIENRLLQALRLFFAERP